MSRKSSKPSQPRPLWMVITTWVCSLLSTGLLYLAAIAVDADLASFRSCSANSSGLTISNCGKQSLNPGDLILIALLILSACLTVTLFTAAWRMTRRGKA